MKDPLFLGIEIGGTKLQLGVGRGEGEPIGVATRHVRPELGARAILSEILETTRALLDKSSASGFQAIGVGFGGPVDPLHGIILRSHHVAGWEDFPLIEWLRDTFSVSTVVMNNDADSAAFAEAHYGAGRTFDPMLYVNSGSGVGGGLIIGGEIYRGSGLGALEIGHIWLPCDRSELGRETLESIASGWSIARSARELLALRSDAVDVAGSALIRLADGDLRRVTGKVVAQAATMGDPDALTILSQATGAMAEALAQAVTLLSPRRVVLGGGMSQIDERFWLQPIRAELDRWVFPPLRGTFEVVTASLGQEVVVHGALALARKAWAAVARPD